MYQRLDGAATGFCLILPIPGPLRGFQGHSGAILAAGVDFAHAFTHTEFVGRPSMKLRQYLLGLAATLAAVSVLAAAPAIDGKWNATVDGGQGPMELVFDLKSAGEKLTGNLSMAMM